MVDHPKEYPLVYTHKGKDANPPKFPYPEYLNEESSDDDESVSSYKSSGKRPGKYPNGIKTKRVFLSGEGKSQKKPPGTTYSRLFVFYSESIQNNLETFCFFHYKLTFYFFQNLNHRVFPMFSRIF